LYVYAFSFQLSVSEIGSIHFYKCTALMGYCQLWQHTTAATIVQLLCDRLSI